MRPNIWWGEIWTPVMGASVGAGCPSASLSLGSRALLRGKMCFGVPVALPWQFPVLRSLVVCPGQAGLGSAGYLERRSPQGGLRVSSAVRHVPLGTSAKGWWGIRALRRVQKYPASWQLGPSQGLQCGFYICSSARGSFSPGRTPGRAPKKSLKRGGICLESPECKKHLAAFGCP